MRLISKSLRIKPRLLRTWWMMRLQKRRRDGAAVQLPPFPDVTLWGGFFFPEQTWFDVAFNITVDLKTWPEASLEIWESTVFPTEYQLAAIIPSSSFDYTHYHAAESEASFWFKARYRNGQDVGPFSNEIEIDVSV